MYKSMHFLASVIIPIFLSADLQWITGASSWPSEITYLIIAHGLLPRPRTRSSASSHGGLLTPGPLAFFLLGNPYAHPLPIFKMFPWICNSFLYTEGVNNLCAYLIWWEYFLPPLFPFAGGISPISVKKCRWPNQSLRKSCWALACSCGFLEAPRPHASGPGPPGPSGDAAGSPPQWPVLLQAGMGSLTRGSTPHPRAVCASWPTSTAPSLANACSAPRTPQAAVQWGTTPVL